MSFKTILSKFLLTILTVGMPFLAWASIAVGSGTNTIPETKCEEFLHVSQPSLVSDPHVVSIPLYRDNDGYMGYEFLQLEHATEKDPESFRQFINNRLNASGPQEVGQLVAYASGRETQPSEQEIEVAFRESIPAPFFEDEWNYIRSVLKDASRRNYKFRKISYFIRTELTENRFAEGHNHAGTRTIEYARARLGSNTEVDSLNRRNPEYINNEDYIGVKGSNSVLVFGDVWHRTPRDHSNDNMADRKPRLYTLLTLYL
jgi:hypothetical protein